MRERDDCDVRAHAPAKPRRCNELSLPSRESGESLMP
jgi:hypothetical protein